MKSIASYSFSIFLALSSLGSFSSTNTLAQVIPDDTLAEESSVVMPDVIINDLSSERIEGGALRGSILFHSFEGFDIAEEQGAYFSNPAVVNTIVSRVTGTSRSDILGTLGVLGEANLIFLNPNGILFGPNSQLDLRGSFTASTAGEVKLPNGEEFSALDPQLPSLLTMNIDPLVGLVFEDMGLEEITNEGILTTTEDLVLLANNLNLRGQLRAGQNLKLRAQNAIRINDSEQSPFVGFANERLEIQGSQETNIFALSHPDSGFFSGEDIILRSKNPVIGEARYWSGENFRVEYLDGSLGHLFSSSTPTIATGQDVSFGSYTGGPLRILAGGKVEISELVRVLGVEPATDTIAEVIPLSNGNNVEIDSALRPTLDIRAGIDWASVPSNLVNETFRDSLAFSNMASSADVSVGTIVSEPFFEEGFNVFLSNQYVPNSALSGNISVDSIDTGDIYGGGNIYIDAKNQIRVASALRASPSDLSTIDFSDIGLTFPEDTYFGNGGILNLLAVDNIFLEEGSNISSVGLLGGDILLESRADIFLDDAAIENIAFINSLVLQPETGGDVILRARNIDFSDGGRVLLRTFGTGNGGKITLIANDEIDLYGENAEGLLSGIYSTVAIGAKGSASGIEIDSASLSLREGAQIQSWTRGSGNAGEILIDAESFVEVDGSDRRDIFLSGDDPSYISSGVGINFQDIGNESITGVTEGLTINTPSLSLIGGGLSSNSIANGESGDIEINADSVSLLEGATIEAATFGLTDGGTIRINASDSVVVDGEDETLFSVGSEISSRSGLRQMENIFFPGLLLGNAGNIEINTENLLVSNGADLNASTFGSGDGGQIIINATESVTFDRLHDLTDEVPFGSIGTTAARTTAEAGSRGNAGNIIVNTAELAISNGADLSTSTFSSGDSGRLVINAQESVTLSSEVSEDRKSIIAVGVENTSATGSGSELFISTDALFMSSGGILSSRTRGNGNGGNLLINANNIFLEGSETQILASSLSGAEGRAGKIVVSSSRFESIDGAQIRTATASSQPAGDIVLNVSEQIRLSGENGGLFADTELTSSGQGGNIFVNSQLPGHPAVQAIEIVDGASISVDSQGLGRGGDINIRGNFLRLDNASSISAATQSSTGGNIALNIPGSLYLRRDSLISTNSLGDSSEAGNGGNINFNGGFIFAISQENSDITANAISGNGGLVTVNSEGIYGIAFRDRLTPFSDITASSEQGNPGNVSINTPEIDPTQGLTVLPEEPRETEITNDCQTATTQDSVEFFNLRRGGSPPSPSTVQSSSLAITPWIPSQLADPTQTLQTTSLSNPMSLEALSTNAPNSLTIACHAN